MSWRPPHWENPYPEDIRNGRTYASARIWEDGADAMLEALKAKGTRWDGKTDIIEDTFGLHPIRLPVLDIKKAAGTLVFIPDEA